MNHITLRIVSVFLAILLFHHQASHAITLSTPIIIDHTCTKLALIPDENILKAKAALHVAYGHTSHGSQVVTGMTGLVGFKGALYSFASKGLNGALDLRDTPFAGAYDLGNPNRTAWEASTRSYLAAHPEITVVMWSWCGQVSSATEADIVNYCSLMSGLEKDFPGVNFVYMTGHLDGTGLKGNLHLRNEQIRRFCRENNKILYDFADIESYNPDGIWFGDKIPNDACEYDTNGDGSRDGNWALEWQTAHPGEWYACTSAHSQPLNANCKAYAAWWLFARLAGWNGPEVSPVTNLTVADIPNDHGNRLRLTWTASASEQPGLVSWYRICRSRSNTFTTPIPLSRFTSVDSLVFYEQRYTVLIDSVSVGKTEFIDPFVPVNGAPYYYWVQTVGNFGVSKPVMSTTVASLEEAAHEQPEILLVGAYPNPFNSSTIIEYVIEREMHVVLRVYNISGQQVGLIANGRFGAGRHSVIWNASNLPSGIYYYAIQAGPYMQTSKVLLLK